MSFEEEKIKGGEVGGGAEWGKQAGHRDSVTASTLPTEVELGGWSSG